MRRVFLAVDGPKASSPNDGFLVDEVQDLALGAQGFYQTSHLFQPANLGCGKGVQTALDWFFANVSEGFILEDDILPGEDFFPFCGEFLSRYRYDSRVFAVSGYDPVPREEISFPSRRSRFSAITQVWGWATWSRSWNIYRYDLKGWRRHFPLTDRWKAMERSLQIVKFWSAAFDLVADGRLDTWDYQLAYAQLKSRQFTALPTVSLIENHGFGPSATHTQGQDLEIRVSRLTFSDPVLPNEIDHKAELWMYRNFYGVSPKTTVSRTIASSLSRPGLRE